MSRWLIIDYYYGLEGTLQSLEELFGDQVDYRRVYPYERKDFLDQLSSMPYDKKIIVLTDDCRKSEKESEDFSSADTVIIIHPETLRGRNSTNQIVENFRKKYNNKNILIIASSVTFGSDASDYVYILPWFLLDIPIRNKWYKIHSFSKPKYFDILLGLKGPRRDFIFEYLKTNNLLDKNFVSYLKNTYHDSQREFEYYSPDLFEYESPESRLHILETKVFNSYALKFISEFNKESIPVYTSLSRQVPWAIYQNSYYSLVSETQAEPPEAHFFTEKTAKPLYAKRLFILCGSLGTLEKLRSMGFKTFRSVVDESYDLETDDTKRLERAMEQVSALHEKDPREVYSRISSVLEYNHALITNREYFLKPLRRWIFSRL